MVAEEKQQASAYGHAYGEFAVSEAVPTWPTGPGERVPGGKFLDGPSASASLPSSGATDDDARRMLRDMVVLGQLHRTFIVGETDQGLWIVDQHVAHERILYERFLHRGALGSAAVQQLLIPVTVTMSPDRIGLIEQFQAELERLGFILEPFGGTSYIVAASR